MYKILGVGVKLELKNEKLFMNLTSSVFKNNEKIPAKYTCDGENINPPLVFSGVPENTKSLVLIVDDPDAPMGTWVHWIMWNIDPKAEKIKENSTPHGAVEGMTSFNKTGYGGPCPPSGAHHYHFKIYAIDTMLALPASADKLELEKEINGRILDQAELVGVYLRNK